MAIIKLCYFSRPTIRILLQPFWNYAICRDRNITVRFQFIEIAKLELNGGHIGIMLFIEIVKLELTGVHIEIMLIIDITKKELTGGHIEILLFIEMEKNKISRRPYWNYANYSILIHHLCGSWLFHVMFPTHTIHALSIR